MDSVDHLSEKWMGFYKSPDEAQKVLEDKTKILSKDFLIVTSSKQLINNNLQDKKGLFLFKFIIVKAHRG